MVFAAMLASAESSGPSLDLLVLILEAMGVIAGMAIAAAVPLFVTAGRRAVRPSFLAPVCLLWALVASGGWLYLLFARYHWNGEYQKLVMSGFYDPANTSTRPVPNLIFVLVLAAGYAGLIAVSVWARPRPPELPPEEPDEVPPGAPSPHTTNGHPRE